MVSDDCSIHRSLRLLIDSANTLRSNGAYFQWHLRTCRARMKENGSFRRKKKIRFVTTLNLITFQKQGFKKDRHWSLRVSISELPSNIFIYSIKYNNHPKHTKNTLQSPLWNVIIYFVKHFNTFRWHSFSANEGIQAWIAKCLVCNIIAMSRRCPLGRGHTLAPNFDILSSWNFNILPYPAAAFQKRKCASQPIGIISISKLRAAVSLNNYAQK